MECLPWDQSHPYFYLTGEEFYGADPQANLEYWSRAACWTIEEAVALSFGFEPRVVSWHVLKGSGHPFAERYAERRSLAFRARCMDHIKDLNQPGDFIKWASSAGVAFCPQLEQLVKVAGRAGKPAPAGVSESLNPKAKQSLLKLVLGLTIVAYRYDPKKPRGPLIRDVHNDLYDIGINLDEDTIRKWLTEAGDECGDLVTAADKPS